MLKPGLTTRTIKGEVRRQIKERQPELTVTFKPGVKKIDFPGGAKGFSVEFAAFSENGTHEGMAVYTIGSAYQGHNSTLQVF